VDSCILLETVAVWRMGFDSSDRYHRGRRPYGLAGHGWIGPGRPEV